MTSSIQGIILALLIAFLVGILVGYAVMQNRLRQQAEALKVSQRRLEEIEQSHELRLRATTEQLRHDYEAELAETIEHYQDQLSQKTIEMQQIYETRFQVLQQGEPTATTPSAVGTSASVEAAGSAATSSPHFPRGSIEPLPEATDATPSRPELLYLKKQYEMRLKEAAQKLQKAYEKQLTDHARAARADIKAEFEQRLAEKSAECEQQYEQQLAERQAQLEAEYAERLEAFSASQAMMTGAFDIPTPSEIMNTGGDETTMTLPPVETPGAIAAAQYTPEQLQAHLQEATEQLRQEYEQQLEAQQEQFDLRVQDLEAEYKQKMAELTTSEPQAHESSENHDDDDDFGPLDLSDISQLT